MTPRTARAYKAILLDMNGTFMFGEDRFDDHEDYFETYRALGGVELDAATVNSMIRLCHQGMCREYADPERMDAFPALAEALSRYGGTGEAHIPVLEAVFAAHEIGQVPPEFASCLRRLRRSHRLGLVSNIWARKTPWLRHFEAVGIGQVWSTLVFSSDTRSIKPSSALFLKAIADLGEAPSDLLFIGDSLSADILPAKALGMDTAWVGPSACPDSSADWIAPSLLSLEEYLA